MNRNQMIAAGCGGAGCLGLIFVAIVGAVIYFVWPDMMTTTRNSNYNYNTNANVNSNSGSPAESESETVSTSMSDDDRHKLFQAAGATRDSELINEY